MQAIQVFDRFAPFVQEFIYKKSWQSLRPVQVEAANLIFDSSKDLLITSGTASGKTEAAFLPVLSQLYNKPATSVQVLYIGPLKALINDQFERLEQLCDQAGIVVFKWHGDVTSSSKTKFLKQPKGILQITPESIESLLINKPQYLHALFNSLEYVVIDEVHTFLESNRGKQLQSQLHRLKSYIISGIKPRVIGLSATIGDTSFTKEWLNPSNPANVALINPPIEDNSVKIYLSHFSANDNKAILDEVITDIFPLTFNLKTIIFCNNKGIVENLTSRLNKLCTSKGISERYLPHHGSISKEIREDAESRMKSNIALHSVICTSTLEMGIDIGQLDLVVQINSPPSVNSFTQRLGRSGRRGNKRCLQGYTDWVTKKSGAPFYDLIPFDLLKFIAIIELFLKNWQEPPSKNQKAYNVLYHQIMSSLVELSGVSAPLLVKRLIQSKVFNEITIEDYFILLKYLVEQDHIQQLADGSLILGLKGEKIVQSESFYAMFETETEWEAFFETQNLGMILPPRNVAIGDTLLLAGKMWRIKDILPKSLKIYVEPAPDTNNVMFVKRPYKNTHTKVMQKVYELLTNSYQPPYLSPEGQIALNESRRIANNINFSPHILKSTAGQHVLTPWLGTKTVQALEVIIKVSGYTIVPSSPWVICIASKDSVDSFWLNLNKTIDNDPLILEKVINEMSNAQLQIYKFDEFLPIELLRTRALATVFDWNEALAFIRSHGKLDKE